MLAWGGHLILAKSDKLYAKIHVLWFDGTYMYVVYVLHDLLKNWKSKPSVKNCTSQWCARKIFHMENINGINHLFYEFFPSSMHETHWHWHFMFFIVDFLHLLFSIWQRKIPDIMRMCTICRHNQEWIRESQRPTHFYMNMQTYVYTFSTR